MKKISTLFFAIGSMLICKSSFSQCNYTAGGNGQTSPVLSAMTIDGNLSDWSVFLNDPDHNTYDNIGSDMDAPVADASSDILRIAHAQDYSNFYLLVERAVSTGNNMDLLFYADIDNNDQMDFNEPVIHLNWNGSDGSVSVSVLNYFPTIGMSLNTISLHLDGSPISGSLSNRGSIGQIGQASADGKFIEVRIPFSFLKKIDQFGNTLLQLQPGQNFKFHLSSINGNVLSAPAGINDNMGGCITAPILSTLPVSFASFTATLNNNKADLKWTTLTETNVSHFVIEKSTNGTDFSDAGMLFATGNGTDKTTYLFSDNLFGNTAGVIYYRLRTVYNDNKAQYSDTRMIRLAKAGENSLVITAFPNPVTTELNITIPANWQNKKVVYEIFNVNATVASRMDVSYSNQTETIDLRQFSPGIYLVRVSCAGQALQQKIIKQ